MLDGSIRPATGGDADFDDETLSFLARRPRQRRHHDVQSTRQFMALCSIAQHHGRPRCHGPTL
jgi:hypothetical protein